ncbi:MAG: polyprenyl synthetase family protein [Chloroflexi bacterium]|nr:polyprenyl synthetase family protein [Chloroflexota bacterium]
MPHPSKHPPVTAVPPLPEPLLRYRSQVEAELRSAITGSHLHDPQDPELYRILRYHLGWVDEQNEPTDVPGGKAFRPGLCILSCEAAGGTPDVAIPAAAAVELAHNFSLIHDDIQDQDQERRHRATVWTLWGKAEALNAGNALRVVADRTLMRLAERGVPADRLLQASNLLAQRSLQMIQGQYLDISFEDRLNVSAREYKEMIAYKTGALISCAMELGALAGPAPGTLPSLMGEAGWYLGYLFQIRDDILGIWGNESTTGKSQGSDIRRKKKTYPIIYALQNATGATRATLHGIFRKESLSDDDVNRAMDVLEELDARKRAETLASRMSEQALHTLRKVPMHPSIAADFGGIIDFLLLRES